MYIYDDCIFMLTVYAYYVRFNVYFSCVYVGEPLISEMLVDYPEQIRLNQYRGNFSCRNIPKQKLLNMSISFCLPAVEPIAKKRRTSLDDLQPVSSHPSIPVYPAVSTYSDTSTYPDISSCPVEESSMSTRYSFQFDRGASDSDAVQNNQNFTDINIPDIAEQPDTEPPGILSGM